MQFQIDEYPSRKEGTAITEFQNSSAENPGNTLSNTSEGSVPAHSASCVNFWRNLFRAFSMKNKISQAVKNRAAFVNFDSAKYVRPVADKRICSGIDARMRQRSQKFGGNFRGAQLLVSMNSKKSQIRVSAGSANREVIAAKSSGSASVQYAAGTAGDKLVSQKIKAIFRCSNLRISGNAMSNISQRVEFIGSKPVRGPYSARIESRPRSHFAIPVCRERAVRKCGGARDERHAARCAHPNIRELVLQKGFVLFQREPVASRRICLIVLASPCAP